MSKTLGFRAHDFGTFNSVEALASAVASHRNPAVIQLAFQKALANAPSMDSFTEDFALQTSKTLKAHGVSIAVLGCYINPVHPDPAILEQHLSRFERFLRFNKAFGCQVVGTETGSARPDCDLHTAEPRYFDTLLHSVERLVKAAEKYDGIVAIEAVARQHTLSTVERMSRVLEKFPSDHLKVIYDPVNLTPWLGIPEKDGSYRTQPSAEAQEAFFRHAFDAFGTRIAAIHAKDYVLDENGIKVGDKSLGTGVVDWKLFFSLLDEYGIDVPILLEDLNPATVDKATAHLDSF